MTPENKKINVEIELKQFNSAMMDAKALLGLERYNGAATRIYYAVFHMITAASNIYFRFILSKPEFSRRIFRKRSTISETAENGRIMSETPTLNLRTSKAIWS